MGTLRNYLTYFHTLSRILYLNFTQTNIMLFSTKMVNSSKAWVFGSAKSKENFLANFPLLTRIVVDHKVNETQSNSAGIPMVKVTIYGLDYHAIEACFREGLRTIEESLAYDKDKKDNSRFSTPNYNTGDRDDAIIRISIDKPWDWYHICGESKSGYKNSFGALSVDSEDEEDEEEEIKSTVFDMDFPSFGKKELPKVASWPKVASRPKVASWPKVASLPKVASRPIQQQTIPPSVEWGSPEIEDDW